MAAEGSVAELAKQLGIEVQRLLGYLKDANLPKKANDVISNKEKVELTRALRSDAPKGEKIAESKKGVLKLGARKKLSISKDSSSSKTSGIEVKRVKSRASAVVKKTLVSTDILTNLQTEISKKEEEYLEKHRIEQELIKKAQEEKENLLKQQKAKESEAKESGAKVAVVEKVSEKPASTAALTPIIEKPVIEEDKKKTAKAKKANKKAVKSSAENIPVHKITDLSIIKDEDELEAQQKAAKKEKERRARILSDNQHGFKKPVGVKKIEVIVPENITVGDLAKRLAVKSSKVIRTLMKMGTMATVNELLDQDTAVLLVEEMGQVAKTSTSADLENSITNAILEQQSDEKARAPVVTIMGHVDHGKTSLLDYIRKTKVVSGEAGGITQHIGAYQVKSKKRVITFLDTPGHAAFSAMRARGANCTDIVVLVVAADDGVKPQTIEAIQHAKASGVVMIVAVNKIDKEDADPEKAKTDVSQHDVLPEDWGGEVPFINVSAKTGAGVDNLLETIALQSEMLELKAPSKGPASGVVIESRLDKGRGAVATILVRSGELKKGDVILVGTEFGKVRAMLDATGSMLSSAGPATPVEILGLSAVPQAGDELLVMSSEKEARELANDRINLARQKELKSQNEDKLAVFMGQMAQGNVQELNVIIKTDVQGSSEALADSLIKLSTDEVKVNVLGKGVGGINESDVTLAMTANAIIIGFNVRADKSAKTLAEREKVAINYYSVIYNAIDDVKNMMIGMLSPEFQEKILGLAEVKDVFRSSKLGAIAGCIVTEGVLKRSSPIRVLRDNVVIYEGELESLRRFKEDVTEVKSGTECGLGVKNYNDVKVGDNIEVFEKVEIQRTL